MKKVTYIIIIVVVAVVIGVIAALSRPVSAPSSGPAGAAAPTPTTSSTSGSPDLGGYFGEKTSATLGTYLTDANGMTLYTFTHDTTNTSNCIGACLTKWFPYGPGIKANVTGVYNLPMLPANVGTTKGNNGMVQFTWKGMPLYYYFLDKAPGQTLGQGVLNAWYVVNP